MAVIGGRDAPGLSYRPDVDGLRAIAVLAVIAFHASPGLVPGGFVGVDIFFVISGYLISGLIVAGLGAGSFSFVSFYQRRIRRLFPALIVVLLATWALGVLTLLPTGLIALGKQMLAAVAFAGNILNFFEAGYFDTPAISKPLLHLWSLGVEEQFYLVYPVLLIALLRFRTAWFALALIGVASFALNIGLIRDHASFTFYLPFTRFWEFIAGALLAPGLAPPRLSKGAQAGGLTRDLIAAAGLALIALAIALTRHDGFPGWMALLPVAGTAAMIGAGPNALVNRALAHPKLVYIGLISYPLYLWHWPLLVTGRTIMQSHANQHERTTALIAVALALVLATLTYRFIERPIRERSVTFALPRLSLRLAGGMAAITLIGIVTVQARGFLFAYPPAVQALLVPLPFDFINHRIDPNANGPVLAIYGDSHAGHLLPGLLRLGQQRSFRIVDLPWGRCSPLIDATPDRTEKCDVLHTANRRALAQYKPGVVVIAAFWSYYKDIGRLAETLRSLREAGVHRMVVIGSVPFWPRPPQQLLYEAYRSNPQNRIPDRLFGFDEDSAKIDRMVEAVATAGGATFVSAHDVLCNADGCLARLGDRAPDIVQVDRTHFSDLGSQYFIDRIVKPLLGTDERSVTPSAALESRTAN